MVLRVTTQLVDLMVAEGFTLPKECLEARIIIREDQALMIQYDCYLIAEDAAKLGRAFERLVTKVEPGTLNEAKQGQA